MHRPLDHRRPAPRHPDPRQGGCRRLLPRRLLASLTLGALVVTGLGAGTAARAAVARAAGAGARPASAQLGSVRATGRAAGAATRHKKRKKKKNKKNGGSGGTVPAPTPAPPPPPPTPGPAPGGATPGQVLSDTNPDPAATSWTDADAPDPFVLPVDASRCAPDVPNPTACYYAYTTNVVFNPVPLWRSADLVHWYMAGADDPDPTAPRDANAFPDGTAVDPSRFARWSSEAFDKWAPAVMEAGGQYVMWYSARNGHGVHCLGIATAPSPDGPFRDVVNRARLCRDSQGGVIDASPFTDTDGQRYLTYKTEGTASQPPRIYVAPLGADGMTLGAETLLLERQGGWEQPRIEGPTFWRAPEGLFLFYSAGDWETSSYVVGVARCSGPLGPCTRVYTTSVLATRGAALGPGGQTPFVDAGGGLRLAFHAWTPPDVGYPGGARSLRFLSLTFPGGNPKVG